MKPEAIVYTSSTGFTRRYAYMLADKTGLEVYDIKAAKAVAGKPVIYMGWLMAGSVKDYSKARKRFDIRAVCGVGLCPTGALLDEVRRTAKIPADVPLFTVQGGMDHEKLHGVDKFMIKMLVKMLSAKKDKSAGEQAMLDMIIKGGDFVDEKNLAAVLDWFGTQA